VSEPLRICGLCGMRAYRGRDCNYVGILHPAPDYTRHEES